LIDIRETIKISEQSESSESFGYIKVIIELNGIAARNIFGKIKLQKFSIQIFVEHAWYGLWRLGMRS
jgi:hypothetical protein